MRKVRKILAMVSKLFYPAKKSQDDENEYEQRIIKIGM